MLQLILEVWPWTGGGARIAFSISLMYPQQTFLMTRNDKEGYGCTSCSFPSHKGAKWITVVYPHL